MMSIVHKWSPRTAVAVIAFALSGASAVSGAPVTPPQDVEFPAETSAIIAATTAYFDAVEGQNDEAVPRMTIEGAIARPVNFETSDEMRLALQSDYGPVQHLTGYRINWYPTDRFLGAVDFMGTYDGNRNLVCGYVLWDLSEPEAPTLENVVATYVDVGRLNDASPTDAHQQLLEANCAYGEINPNFTLFNP